MTDSLLALVPHEYTHRAPSILKQALGFRAQVAVRCSDELHTSIQQAAQQLMTLGLQCLAYTSFISTVEDMHEATGHNEQATVESSFEAT